MRFLIYYCIVTNYASFVVKLNIGEDGSQNGGTLIFLENDDILSLSFLLYYI